VKEARGRLYPLLYPAWALVCAMAFVALTGAADPSRPSGRVSPEDAKASALGHLREFDRERFVSYHVIDAGVYRDVQRDEKIWVVLCDTTPRSALARAVVVDLDADSGRVVRTRRPAGVPLEEFPIP